MKKGATQPILGVVMPSIILSKKQTAELLGVHVTTVHNLLMLGEIPRVQLSARRIGMLRSDIDSYIQNHRTTASTIQS